MSAIDAVGQPAEHAQRADIPLAVPSGRNEAGRSERRPDIGGVRKLHALGHHADDRRRPRVQAEGPAEHAGIRSVPVLPHLVPDDDHRVGSGPLVARDEITPEERRLPQHAEKVRCHQRAVSFLGQGTVVADVRRGFRVRREGAEAPTLVAQVVQLGVREVRAPAGTVLPRQDVEAVCLFERQSAEECGIHDREAGRVRPDPERQRDEDRSRQPGIFGDQPRGKPEVLDDGLQAGHPSEGAMLLPQRRRASDANHGRPPRLIRGHPTADVVLGQHRDVGAQLLREVAIELAPPEERVETGRQLPQRREHLYLRPPRSSSRPITPETRSQFFVSARSCLRPARDIE